MSDARKKALTAAYNAGLQRAAEIADEQGHLWSGATANFCTAKKIRASINAEKQ